MIGKRMPRRKTVTKATTHQAMKNASYESKLAGWLMQDGWQLFSPVLDHGHKTDILISDGPNYYRIQVKTIAAKNDDVTAFKKDVEKLTTDLTDLFAERLVLLIGVEDFNAKIIADRLKLYNSKIDTYKRNF